MSLIAEFAIGDENIIVCWVVVFLNINQIFYPLNSSHECAATYCPNAVKWLYLQNGSHRKACPPGPIENLPHYRYVFHEEKSFIFRILHRMHRLTFPTNPYFSADVVKYRPAYLYRFSRDIPIFALNHDFLIYRFWKMRKFLGLADFVLFCFRRHSRILPAFCTYR